MDNKIIQNEINVFIQKLKEYSSGILDKDEISDVDMAYLLDYSSKLHEHLIVLNYLKTSKTTTSVQKNIVTVNKVPDTIANERDKRSIEEIKTTQNNSLDADISYPSFQNTKSETKKEKQNAGIKNIQKPKIDNLNTAIGLNDKFQFANELFEGNMKEYNISIHQLNTAETIESAMDYITTLQQLYNWDFENETTKRLIDLVDRRFIF